MKNQTWITFVLALTLTTFATGCYETDEGLPDLTLDDPKDGVTDGSTEPTTSEPPIPMGEWGDAPDEQDSFYRDPVSDFQGHFPTSIDTGNCRIDPGQSGAWAKGTTGLLLGEDASLERGSRDTDDPDGAANEIDDDGFDDGFVGLDGTPEGQHVLTLRVSNEGEIDGIGYLNVLVDQNRDGRWQNTSTTEPEWVAANLEVLMEAGTSREIRVEFAGSGLELEAWTRVSFTSEPVSDPGDGSGWDGCGTFEDGEIEDYLLARNSSFAWDFDFDSWYDDAKDDASDWASATDEISEFAKDQSTALEAILVQVSAEIDAIALAVSEAEAYALSSASSLSAAEASAAVAAEALAVAEAHSTAAAVSVTEASDYAAAMSTAVASTPCATAVASADAQAAALVTAATAASASASVAASASASAFTSAQAFAVSASTAHAEALASAGAAAALLVNVKAEAEALAIAVAQAKAQAEAVGIAHAEASAHSSAASEAWADALAASDSLAEAVSVHGWVSTEASAQADAFTFAIAKAFAKANATADAWIDGWAQAKALAEVKVIAEAHAEVVIKATILAAGYAVAAQGSSASALAAAGAAADSAALSQQFVTAAQEGAAAASSSAVSASSATAMAGAFTNPDCKEKVCAELTIGCTTSLGQCEGDKGDCLEGLGQCETDKGKCQKDLGQCDTQKDQCQGDLDECDTERMGLLMEIEMLTMQIQDQQTQIQQYQMALMCAVEVAPHVLDQCPIPSSFGYGK